VLLDEILSQPGPVGALRGALERQQLAQAYLFEGPSGVGKQKTAMALACTAVCRQPEPGCGTCEACRRVLALNHPDVRVYEPREEGNRNIQVDLVRDEIVPFTQFAPFEADRAFLVFPRADVSFPEQHAEAANALLKSLEEPRPGIHFILLAERPDRLLPTIRSRCQRIRFRRLPAETIERILGGLEVEEGVKRVAAALASGQADRALELGQGQKAFALTELALRVDAAVEEARPGPLLDLAAELARDDDLELILETLALYYRDLAAVSLDLSPGQSWAAGRQQGSLQQRAGELGARRAADRAELVQRAAENLERNANTELQLDAMLFALGSV
jgi:DNA polymerase-3 subunit delta'